MDFPSGYQEKFRPQKNRPRCDRNEMLDKFLAALKASNKPGYPPYTHSRVAGLLEAIPTEDLEAIFRKCSTYRSFGAGLTYELKPKV